MLRYVLFPILSVFSPTLQISWVHGLYATVAISVLMLMGPRAFAENRDDPFQRVAASDDVQWLESVAGSMARAEEEEPSGQPFRNAPDLRTAAYARLGALGTRQSLAAAERIEQKAKARLPIPHGSSPASDLQPRQHFANGRLSRLAQVKGNSGTTYAIVRSSLLGGEELFMISSRTTGEVTSWSRPRLIPGTSSLRIRKPSLSARDDDVLLLSFTLETPENAHSLGQHELEISIGDILRDKDQDGWTDFEELRLGLDPDNSDSDNDGVIDGKDKCPGFAPSADHDESEEIEILQKAIFATFGVSDSWHLLIVLPTSRKLHVWGYGGPVIYLAHQRQWWLKRYPGGAMFVNWSVTRDGDQARVTIEDYEGSNSATVQHVLMKRIDNRWYVVQRRVSKVG